MQTDVSMHVPATPLTLHEGGGVPLDELVLVLVDELLDDPPPAPLELLLDEPVLLLPVGVQHCSEAAPGQWPGVET
jgi:hypothetical protein